MKSTSNKEFFKRTSNKPFSALITLGLEKGYSKEPIKKSVVINFLQDYQNELIKEKDIVLSVSVCECDIVLSGQVEPHLKLSLINYPKFPMEESILKKEIENLTISLMNYFAQNRVVIEFLNETVMFENSDMIDPRIKNMEDIKSEDEDINQMKRHYNRLFYEQQIWLEELGEDE